MLELDDVVLLVIDVQGKLAQLMDGKEQLFDNLKKIIKGAAVLEAPIIWTEQYPEGLGPTLPEIAELMPDFTPIPKTAFSCCREERFLDALSQTRRRQVLLTGIESHICIYQTAVGLLDRGYDVNVVADAVASRKLADKAVALEKMRDAGAKFTTIEMALFELLKVAEGPKFKAILDIVK